MDDVTVNVFVNEFPTIVEFIVFSFVSFVVIFFPHENKKSKNCLITLMLCFYSIIFKL